jgi:Icc-related predicted phosphoesterase
MRDPLSLSRQLMCVSLLENVRWFDSYARMQVVFIAGNHDTQLDGKVYDDRKARAILRTLPSNVHYLENSGVTVSGGIRVWGSPVCVSRLETMGKRYYSNAFERTKAERVKVWAQIPDDPENRLDILLTHIPPRSRLAHGKIGDKVLRNRLENDMKAPPRCHCFGHDHDSLGIQVTNKGRTLTCNSAQEQLLRLDREAGGHAWVFDLKVPVKKEVSSMGLQRMTSIESA